MVVPAVKFPAAFIAGYGPADGFYALDDHGTTRADVGVVTLHFPALEGEIVKWFFPWDTEVCAGGLPFWAVWIDATAAAALVGDEVGKLVLERTPNFLWLAVFELGIELDGAIWPPRSSGSGLHSGVPAHAHFASELG